MNLIQIVKMTREVEETAPTNKTSVTLEWSPMPMMVNGAEMYWLATAGNTSARGTTEASAVEALRAAVEEKVKTRIERMRNRISAAEDAMALGSPPIGTADDKEIK